MEPSLPTRDAGFLFPKGVHLLRTGDFRKVYAGGRRKNLTFLLAFSLPNGLATSRIGLTVPRSVGGAVRRNRLKRRLREAARKHLFELSAGWDIVINARGGSSDASAAEVEELVAGFFRSLRNTPPGGPVKQRPSGALS